MTAADPAGNKQTARYRLVLSYITEEAAMFTSFVTVVAQARLDDLHRKAQRDAQARAARRARTHQHGHRGSGLPAIAARWPRRRRDRAGRPPVTRPAPAPPEHDTRVPAQPQVPVTARSRS